METIHWDDWIRVLRRITAFGVTQKEEIYFFFFSFLSFLRTYIRGNFSLLLVSIRVSGGVYGLKAKV